MNMNLHCKFEMLNLNKSPLIIKYIELDIFWPGKTWLTFIIQGIIFADVFKWNQKLISWE